jgi:hypothetical protein
MPGIPGEKCRKRGFFYKGILSGAPLIAALELQIVFHSNFRSGIFNSDLRF